MNTIHSVATFIPSSTTHHQSLGALPDASPLTPLRLKPEHRSLSCPNVKSIVPMPAAAKSFWFKSGDYKVVPQTGRVNLLGTDGIGCCVALAMRGKNTETGQYDVLLAHLDSQQYAPPGNPDMGRFGGKTDLQLMEDDDMRGEHRAETVQKTREFARTHTDLEAVAATNHVENPLNLSQCLFLKLAVTPPPAVYFLDDSGTKSASVALDVPQFKLYKVDPETKTRIAPVETLKPMSTASP